jgi:hypothetical protein
LGVAGREVFREQRVDVGSDELVPGVAEEVDGSGVGIEDPAGRLDRENRVR